MVKAKATPPAKQRPVGGAWVVAPKAPSASAFTQATAPKSGIEHKAAAEACHSPGHSPGRSPTAAALPALLSVEATALQLSVSTKTVRRLIERGALPCCRVGRMVRIRAADLERFVASGTGV